MATDLVHALLRNDLISGQLRCGTNLQNCSFDLMAYYRHYVKVTPYHQEKIMRAVITLLSVLLVSALLFACDEDVAITIDAASLYAEYDANLIAAEEKFQGRTVIVTGIVTEIGEIFNQPYVTLTDGDVGWWGAVDCYFDNSTRAQITQLTKDEEITLKGRVRDYQISVEVRGCSLVE